MGRDAPEEIGDSVGALYAYQLGFVMNGAQLFVTLDASSCSRCDPELEVNA
jgi:hypothetical protein